MKPLVTSTLMLALGAALAMAAPQGAAAPATGQAQTAKHKGTHKKGTHKHKKETKNHENAAASPKKQ